MKRKELTDEQWNRIKDHLPERTERRGRPAKCNRMIINAILWVLRTGAPLERYAGLLRLVEHCLYAFQPMVS